MELSPDLIDLLREFSAANVRFLVVGAYAVVYHTEPRYTKDLDLWVEASSENAARVWQALVQFGAPLRACKPEDFANPKLVYQIGCEPNRVDIMMGVDGVTFPAAWKNRVKTEYAGIPVCVLGRKDLIRAKRAAGRPLDLIDAERLQRRKPRRTARKRRR